MWIVTFKLSGDVLQTYTTDFNTSNTTTSSTVYRITAVTINIASGSFANVPIPLIH